MRDIEILKEPTDLHRILKFENLVTSGGEAKFVIAEGHVSVNGDVETRKRRKIVAGDIVEYGNHKLHIKIRGDSSG